jgi:hypothetical protein
LQTCDCLNRARFWICWSKSACNGTESRNLHQIINSGLETFMICKSLHVVDFISCTIALTIDFLA